MTVKPYRSGCKTARRRGIIRSLLGGAFILPALSGGAHAHVSEQGFVLLLPTGIYITAGVAAVALTVLILAAVPHRLMVLLFKDMLLVPGRLLGWARTMRLPVSLLSTLLLFALIGAGYFGSRDPLGNPLPLMIWTVWWIGLLVVQGLIGDIWRWINPWTGLYALLRGAPDAPGLLTLPSRVGSAPAILGFIAFAAFLLADLAPDDPARLAVVVAVYWGYAFLGMVLFGARDWLDRGEWVTLLMRHFATMAALGPRNGGLAIGFPGWQVIAAPALRFTAAIFVICILATGTYDGINETFWWLDQIGINPLEFPGRSAVVTPTLVGLIGSNLLLVLMFALTVWLGFALIGEGRLFRIGFCRLAYSILPIAVGYHAAHYLTSFLVNGQYALAAATDPFGLGWDVLGLGVFHVTTGFFNSQDTVEVIWLTQAGAIVIGHVVAVLVAHTIALDMVRDGRKAMISQVPLAVFMIAYTFAGLTLLASPRGV